MNPSWSFVDGGDNIGLNRYSSKNATYPKLRVGNGKLYLTYEQSTLAGKEAALMVYNANDTSPLWTFIDTQALAARDITDLAFLSGKMYVSGTQVGNLSKWQVRVFVNGGSDAAPQWNAVDGSSLNLDTAQDAASISLAVWGSQLSVFFAQSASGYFQIRSRVYNGVDASPTWGALDTDSTTGLNPATNTNSVSVEAIPCGTNLCMIWGNNIGGSQEFAYVRISMRTPGAASWTALDVGSLGLNFDARKPGVDSALLYSSDGKLYAAWAEGGDGHNQIRASVLKKAL